jgi:threonine synthase
MHYFSTNRKSPHVTFREATITGQPDDKGLYFPYEIPKYSADFISNLLKRSNAEIAFEVIRPFTAGEIDDESLFSICAEAVNFNFPLVKISDAISALELFHGPTFAFKDVGARFMSRCLKYFSDDSGQKTAVIVATSGDTGGAVANGFYGIEGIEVVILYPKGKVSGVQEAQLTTLDKNVTAVEIHGNFDDCQRLAKQALGDEELKKNARLTSANSINIARWLPQQFYYYYALKQWNGEPPVISVPSGNFGNLAAGLLAAASGLPIKKFIAACNANDTVPEFMKTGQYSPKPSVHTLSNAMDVGDPSNFVRILESFDGEVSKLAEGFNAATISDVETVETIRDVYQKYGYVLDPHGAVGYRALSDYLNDNQMDKGIVLETAHPVKFESIKEIIDAEIEIPKFVRELNSLKKKVIEIEADYGLLKEIIHTKI